MATEGDPVRLVLEMRTAVRKLSGVMVRQNRDSLGGEPFHLSPVYHAGPQTPDTLPDTLRWARSTSTLQSGSCRVTSSK